jgi:hypothetical protein
MSGLSALEILFVFWAAVTALFVGLLIYRSLVGMKEEDTLILSERRHRTARWRCGTTRVRWRCWIKRKLR